MPMLGRLQFVPDSAEPSITTMQNQAIIRKSCTISITFTGKNRYPNSWISASD
jgi:hypothetical protein